MRPVLEYSPYTMQHFLEARTKAASQWKGQHTPAHEAGPAKAGKVRRRFCAYEPPWQSSGLLIPIIPTPLQCLEPKEGLTNNSKHRKQRRKRKRTKWVSLLFFAPGISPKDENKHECVICVASFLIFKKSAFPTPRVINKVFPIFSILHSSSLIHAHDTRACARTHAHTFLKPEFIFRPERVGVPHQGPLLLSRHSQKALLPDRKSSPQNLLDELPQNSDFLLTRRWKKYISKNPAQTQPCTRHTGIRRGWGFSATPAPRACSPTHSMLRRGDQLRWHPVHSLPCECAIPCP